MGQIKGVGRRIRRPRKVKNRPKLEAHFVRETIVDTFLPPTPDGGNTPGAEDGFPVG